MALKSPRFAAEERLRRASENRPPLERYETGEPVRLIQQALVDLGFALPISYRKFGSPDGIFGSETVAKVRAFQTKFRFAIDGIVGRQTMAKLDELLPAAGKPLLPLPAGGFTHRIGLHLRSIDMPQVAEFTQLKIMQDVFAQYAIKVEMLSGESVHLKPDEELTLTVVDGDCEWDQVSDEQRLLENLGSKQSVGRNDITVYFATTLREKDGKTLQGCAGHAPDRPAVMIASTAIDKTTMAHEVCHVLLGKNFAPVHVHDAKNLMCDAPVCTGNPAHLTDDQLATIRGSRFLTKIA
jgi:hypothetical protein